MDYKRLFIPNSLVFITVVTKYRRKILIDNIAYLRQAFVMAQSWHKFNIIAIIINHDHFHMIIKPEDMTSYPKIIGNIKGTFTKLSSLSYTVNKKRESTVWQRRYWEHTIRDEKDLYKHIDYIHYNSVKHYGISPQKWLYSSFRKFVKEGYYPTSWCNMDDKYHIKDINWE